MLEEIKKDLADNYRGDDDVLLKMVERVQSRALSISNRNESDLKDIEPYIVETVKALYIKRGAEGMSSISEGSQSSSFEDAIEKMRRDIIVDGMRLMP